MNQNNTNKPKTPTLMLIYLIIILLTPPITVLITLIIQLIKQKNRIKNSKEMRILSLNNITKPITIYELSNYDKLSCFNFIPYNKLKKKYIKCDPSIFLNMKCTKEYFFTDDKLDFCNYQMNKSGNPSAPKYIFRELRKTNGDPDEIHYDKDISLLECIWYGKNGYLIFRRYISNMVEIVFEIKQII